MAKSQKSIRYGRHDVSSVRQSVRFETEPFCVNLRKHAIANARRSKRIHALYVHFLLYDVFPIGIVIAAFQIHRRDRRQGSAQRVPGNFNRKGWQIFLILTATLILLFSFFFYTQTNTIIVRFKTAILLAQPRGRRTSSSIESARTHLKNPA